ncbi:MAG: helix-turn-helix domain-containing protein [Henriciella sp.]|nr:helix-turn-helix domain-containing protein [Henriciella sp.]
MADKRKMPVGLCKLSRFEAVRRLELSTKECAVLKELVERAPQGRCFPNIQTLARDTKYHERTVRRALKGLVAKRKIRRTRARKDNGQLAGYRYFLTFPGHIPPNASGQSVKKPQDTESAQNRNLEPLDSGEVQKLVITETQVFDLLEDVLDLRRDPSLIYGTALTLWLYDHWCPDSEALIHFVMTDAERLAAQLRSTKSRLVDWQFFIDRLNQRLERGLTEMPQSRAAMRLDRRVRPYLRKCFRRAPKPLPDIADRITITLDDDVVVLEMENAYDFGKLCQRTDELKSLASAIEYPLCVEFEDQLGQIHYPSSFG